MKYRIYEDMHRDLGIQREGDAYIHFTGWYDPDALPPFGQVVADLDAFTIELVKGDEGSVWPLANWVDGRVELDVETADPEGPLTLTDSNRSCGPDSRVEGRARLVSARSPGPPKAGLAAAEGGRVSSGGKLV